MSDSDTVYMMPKLNMLASAKQGLEQSPPSIDYMEVVPVRKRSVLDTIVSGALNGIGFILVLALFLGAVSVTSVALVTISQSGSIRAMQSQDIPSDGYRNVPPPNDPVTLRSIEK